MSDATDTNPELPDYAQPQKGSEADESTVTTDYVESSRSTETADDADPLEEGDFNPLTQE